MHAIRTLAAAAALAFASATPLHAAEPAGGRPVTLIVPFAAGGGVDGMGRLLAERLRAEMPQGVVVENKPGASACWARRRWCVPRRTARPCCWARRAKPRSIRLCSRARCNTSRIRTWRRSR